MSKLTNIHITLYPTNLADTGFNHLEISFKNWRNHSISLVALSRVMNSDSIIERVIHVCWEDFQDITVPPSMKTYSLMDFESFISDIQFTLQDPSSTVEKLVYCSPKSRVYLK